MVSRAAMIGVIAASMIGHGTPPLPPSGHRYWRIYVEDTGTTGSFNPLIKEIQMATSAGGSNVCSGGTPIGSGGNPGEGIANAFDGSTSTFWQWNTRTGSWIGYDFGSGNDKDIYEIRAYCWGTYFDRFPRIGYIQYSDDGTTWATDWRYFIPTNPSDGYVTFARPSIGGAARYWALFINNWSLKGFDATSLVEIEFRETVGGADATGSGTAITTPLISYGYGAANAFDNNTGTLWASAGGTPGVTAAAIGYDFGSGVTKNIAQASITARATPYHPQTATDFKLIRSSDKINWELVQSFTPTGWTSLETRTFNV